MESPSALGWGGLGEGNLSQLPLCPPILSLCATLEKDDCSVQQHVSTGLFLSKGQLCGEEEVSVCVLGGGGCWWWVLSELSVHWGNNEKICEKIRCKMSPKGDSVQGEVLSTLCPTKGKVKRVVCSV